MTPSKGLITVWTSSSGTGAVFINEEDLEAASVKIRVMFRDSDLTMLGSNVLGAVRSANKVMTRYTVACGVGCTLLASPRMNGILTRLFGERERRSSKGVGGPFSSLGVCVA